MSRFIGLKIDIGACMLTAFDEDGYPVAQVDAIGDDPQVAPYELHHQYGFYSRPRDPVVDQDNQPQDGKACNLFVGVEGDKLHAWLGYDPRLISLLPRVKKGGSMQYSHPGSFSILDGEDGTQTTYVPIPNGEDSEGNPNTPTQAHAWTMGVDGNGDPVVSLITADSGAFQFFQQQSTWSNASGDAYIQLHGGGCVLNGNTVVNGGATIGSPAAALPMAIAPHLISYLTSLEALLTGLAAAVDAKLPPSPGASAGTVTAFIAATSALKASIAATRLSAL